jgi:Uma2 family endonuclease
MASTSVRVSRAPSPGLPGPDTIVWWPLLRILALTAPNIWRYKRRLAGGRRVELIAGEAVATPPSGGEAASAQGELFFALRRWLETSGDGGLLLQDVFIRLSGEDYLAPELAWCAAARRPRLVQGALDVVPDLVVEVLSPATRINISAQRKTRTWRPVSTITRIPQFRSWEFPTPSG